MPKKTRKQKIIAQSKRASRSEPSESHGTNNSLKDNSNQTNDLRRQLYSFNAPKNHTPGMVKNTLVINNFTYIKKDLLKTFFLTLLCCGIIIAIAAFTQV